MDGSTSTPKALRAGAIGAASRSMRTRRRFANGSREFPTGAKVWDDDPSRRTFLKLMGASLALAGASGCSTQQAEKIVPYVRAPEQIVPGKPLHYATTLSAAGAAVGVLVESHMGRPTMIEGNPDHPASLGAIDPYTQASILSLYDPDRSKVIIRVLPSGRRITTWDAFQLTLTESANSQFEKKGAGLRILTETVDSPTLALQINALLERFPLARWHEYEPAGNHEARAAAKEAFGEPVSMVHDFAKANVVVSLDADFLGSGAGKLVHARRFADRRAQATSSGMNRLYVVEPVPSITGSTADHRWALAASEVGDFAFALAAKLGLEVGAAKDSSVATKFAKEIDAIAADLQRNKGKSIVIAGDHQPKFVHVLAHAINNALGNLGQSVLTVEPVEPAFSKEPGTLRDLHDDMAAGKVDFLLVLGGNPVYTAPADLDFAKALAKVPLSTTSACTTTRPRRRVSGTCLAPTHSRNGATIDRSTALRRSNSRS